MRRRPLGVFLQVNVPSLIRDKLLLATKQGRSANMSDYMRECIYSRLFAEGLLTPMELAEAMVGHSLPDSHDDKVS